MFPLRSHHLVSRTPAGEKAWQELRLPPAQRKLLGLLRQPLPVSALLDSHGAEPGILEDLVWNTARAGYLRVDVVELPPPPVPPSPEPEPRIEKVDQDRALQDLLDRHRAPEPEDDAPPADAPSNSQTVKKVSVAETPLPLPPSAESAAALARALMGGDKPNRKPDSTRPDSPPSAPSAPDDGFLIKSSADLMRALMGKSGSCAGAPLASAPYMDQPQDEDSLPDIQLDAPYSADPPAKDKKSLARADREDTFLRITEVIKSRQGSPGPGRVQPPGMPDRARGESDVAYAARLQAVEARAKRQAAEEVRREQMAERRRQEAADRQNTTRKGLSDRLRQAMHQRDSGRED